MQGVGLQQLETFSLLTKLRVLTLQIVVCTIGSRRQGLKAHNVDKQGAETTNF